MGKEIPASISFMAEAMLGITGPQSLLHLGALSLRLSMESLVFIAACNVRSSCILYLVVVSIVVRVVLSHPILCPLVREW